MSPGEWKGSNIVETNRTLILGESHYEDDSNSIGKEVPYSTAGVVEEYLSQHCKTDGRKGRWHRFFDRIAESFGYSKEHSVDFYKKIWFGNYVNVLCGTGEENKACHYMNKNRKEYNDELFSFVNSHDIDVIACFSKEVFWHLPAMAKEDSDSYRELSLPLTGGRKNVINYYEYAPGVKHDSCDVELKKPLKVYGIRHPSARGGFNASQVYKVISNEDALRDICTNNSR